jgi:dihydrofolate reductase
MKLRVEGFTISVDGFAAGPSQSLENPLGVRGTALHSWLFATRTFHAKHFGSDDGETGMDDDFAARGFNNVGAWILGRNMFGPVRVGGGATTIRQYLKQRLIDEMHIAIAPVLLGTGERLFDDIDLLDLGYNCFRYVATPRATHILITRT